MATPMRRLCSVTLLKYNLFRCISRSYTIEPPEWMGGKSIIDNYWDRYNFPEVVETFQQKLAKIKSETKTEEPADIGINYQSPTVDRKTMIEISMANRRNKDLEQASRLKTLKVSLDDVKSEWLRESFPVEAKIIATHYGVYRDLFDGAQFTPVVNINVGFEYDDEYVTPVHRGNKIPPNEAKSMPYVSYESASDTLWTLLLTNPDGHLTNNNMEYCHLLVGNIPGCEVSRGDMLVDYLQPIPPRGTGFHRHVFVLFQQRQSIDYSKWKKSTQCALADRTFRTADFLAQHRDLVTPMGLAFFQSQWDDSVRHVYHNKLDMGEPAYEYAHPPAYHPPAKKYPHKEPFDRYFDRYRDKKDLAEEVMRLRLDAVSPFRPAPPREKYPIMHIKTKTYKPTWLKLREEIMHRRLEQYKDMP